MRPPNGMNESDAPLAGKNLELHETENRDLELPVPSKLRSWRGTVDSSAAAQFSETQLARFWSDPEFVRKRNATRITVPFEL
jgi:hypothetical protein